MSSWLTETLFPASLPHCLGIPETECFTPRHVYYSPEIGCIIRMPAFGVKPKCGFIISVMRLWKKWVHTHEWSEWEPSLFNRRVWSHVKTASRYCRKCGESESKVITVECSQQRRMGKWCERCNNVVKSLNMEYIQQKETAMPKTRGIMGRPPKIERILYIKSLFARGMTYTQVQKESGIFNKKTLFRLNHYPQERLEKQIKIAKEMSA